jgi:4-diphosphocytidyl-2-C-methyl-D-erythritol kinase
VTTSVSIRAQAKINLWLRVLAREESGYHSIETMFHRIDLADDITVSLKHLTTFTVSCNAEVGPASENLAVRAAQLYCSAIGWRTGVHIEIDKKIPTRGGLGGGSADAAATLKALNAMSPNRVDDAALCVLAAKLGADVPFLTTDAVAALAWGRGDRLLELAALPRMHVALAISGFGIDTPEAYQSLALRKPWTATPLSLAQLQRWNGVATHVGNDLSDSTAARQHPELAGAIAAFSDAGAIMTEMTGSGSVVFGIFDREPSRDALERATGCRVELTQTADSVDEPRGPGPAFGASVRRLF